MADQDSQPAEYGGNLSPQDGPGGVGTGSEAVNMTTNPDSQLAAPENNSDAAADDLQSKPDSVAGNSVANINATDEHNQVESESQSEENATAASSATTSSELVHAREDIADQGEQNKDDRTDSDAVESSSEAPISAKVAAQAAKEVAAATAAAEMVSGSPKKSRKWPGAGSRNHHSTHDETSSNTPQQTDDTPTAPLWQMPNPKTEEELKAAIEAIRGHPNLPEPPVPVLPKFDSRTNMKTRVKKLQQYISSFEYNHTGTRYFPVHKDKGQLKLTDTAKQIMREALPIQCLEAVMLGCYLTTKWNGVDRVPISFKSFVKPINRSFRHIVLAIRYQGKWGAIGLSRKDTLMYKKIKFPSLSALIKDYQLAYEKCWHVLKKVYIGFPFRHEPLSVAPIKWRVLNLRVDKHPWEEVAESLDAYSKDLKKLASYYHLHKRLPDTFNSTYIFKKAAPKVVPYGTGETLGSPKPKSGATPRAVRQQRQGGTTPSHSKNTKSASGQASTPTARMATEDPNASSDEEPTAEMASDSGTVASGPLDEGDGETQSRRDNGADHGGEPAPGNTTAEGAGGDEGAIEEEVEIVDAPKVSSAQINQAFLAV